MLSTTIASRANAASGSASESASSVRLSVLRFMFLSLLRVKNHKRTLQGACHVAWRTQRSRAPVAPRVRRASPDRAAGVLQSGASERVFMHDHCAPDPAAAAAARAPTHGTLIATPLTAPPQGARNGHGHRTGNRASSRAADGQQARLLAEPSFD